MAKNYIDKEEMYNEIIESKKQGELTDKAKDMMILLADRTIKKKTYYDPTLRDDCYQTGVEHLLSNWHNFDEKNYTNAFAYYTEIFKRAIAKGFNEVTKLKGDDNAKQISIQSSNDGDGMYNL